jgi:hypothetical protein
MVLSAKQQEQCDICASKGPCSYCGRTEPSNDTYTIGMYAMDLYLNGGEAHRITLLPDKMIKVKKLDVRHAGDLIRSDAKQVMRMARPFVKSMNPLKYEAIFAGEREIQYALVEYDCMTENGLWYRDVVIKRV